MELSPDCLSYDFRHKRRDIPAAFCDFLDQARTHIRIFRARHHEQCLAQIIQLAIHQRHLELIFKIGHGADAAQDGARFECGDRIDKESAERHDFNIVDSFACKLQQMHPFFKGEKRVFLRIFRDGDQNLVEDAACPCGRHQDARS